ncbi:hypothetical protein HAX54_047304 [Datura stramonium]|uniref:Uncharacterized protein n=1 Tax=Datura stramonium TaxID=4076 RepID=A0ABS8WKJ6_DATST|nr:hypothetical protein [Datura stramonium]
MPLGSTSKFINSTNRKKEVAARKEIAKKRQLEDDSESDSSSGSEEGNHDVEELGNDDTEAEEFTDKASATEEFGEQVEDFDLPATLEARSKMLFKQVSWDMYYAGLALNDKGNPSNNIKEEPKIQINALNEVPELKKLFEVYNMQLDGQDSG